MTYPKIGIRPTIDGRWGGVRESLEAQTMGMATAAKALIEENLHYPDGTPVQCVLSPTTIGGGAEAAKCAEYFAGENVVATLTVTPCWCYGSETFDMDPHTIKAVWGFNGTERPGAVYLAAVMAAYAQKGLPAFSIYGHDVQDMTDKEIPADVAEKILRFAHAAAAVGWMKNKAYVNLGGIAMGIAGSFCNAEMFQKYFGIRAEWVDMTEIVRRITLGIYDHDEFDKALSWVKANCKEGFDCNAGKDLPEIIRKSKVVDPDKDWAFITKMTMIMRDILYGNPKLDEMGWHEEALGKNAIAGGFQGQRNWTDWLPNADFTEAIMASSFDWNGKKAPHALCHRERYSERRGDDAGHPGLRHRALLPRCAHLLEPGGLPAGHRNGTHRRGKRWLYPPDQLRRYRTGRHRCLPQCQGRTLHETVLGNDGCGH